VCSEFQTYNPATNKCDPIPCDAGFTGWKPVCTPVVVPPVTDLMPFVDKTKEVVPAVGHSTLKIQTTGKQPSGTGDIAFRVFCGISHMNNDDPMVFPGQPNATHHHTYYGQTGVKYNTDLNKLSETGNSTCVGGIMNRSAYWHPTVVNGQGVPLVSTSGNGRGVVFYYKAGFDGIPPEMIVAPPKGLRMLVGNSKAKTAAELKATVYSCLKNSNGTNYSTNSKSFPNCAVGDSLQMTVNFLQCWDGKNLDSPDHISHMANPNGQTANKCPASHPVAIPKITMNMHFPVTVANEVTTWRLSSDNYEFNGSNAGYSGHADWVSGWQQEIIEAAVKGCINAKKDCHGDLLGNGMAYY
jgi:hypothetical protein